MPNKFHSLLASKTSPSLLSNLNLPENEERALVDAAREISRAIKQGFTLLREEVRRQKLDAEIPKPQFAIQGSYIYGTLNAPAHPPKQKVDIDLGTYLPFSVLGNGEQPKTVANYYFEVVTNILSEYIRDKNKAWSIPPREKQKDTCIRVVLNAKTHIDIPLYAVPEEELSRITEAQIALNYQQNDDYPLYLRNDDTFLASAIIEAVSPTVIHLAHRKQGWRPSDALIIRDWVKSNFRAKGNMIRPVNRFLKAWRDQQWPEDGGPSSIFILAHSLRSFPEDTNGLKHCDVLEAVINELPNVFDRPLLIPCPTPEDKNAKEDLRVRISPEAKAEYLRQFRQLKADYARARNEDAVSANQTLIFLFGERMPNDPSRIDSVSDVAATVAGIQSAQPEVKPLYTTDRSNSG